VLALFSAPMERQSTLAAFRIENASGTQLSGKAILDKDVLTFAPATTLTPNERYTVKVDVSAKDLAGQPLAGAVSHSFVVATSAPSQAPPITTATARICAQLVDVNGTTIPGARASRLRTDLLHHHRLGHGRVLVQGPALGPGRLSRDSRPHRRRGRVAFRCGRVEAQPRLRRTAPTAGVTLTAIRDLEIELSETGMLTVNRLASLSAETRVSVLDVESGTTRIPTSVETRQSSRTSATPVKTARSGSRTAGKSIVFTNTCLVCVLTHLWT
jgi:hypothetical protein